MLTLTRPIQARGHVSPEQLHLTPLLAPLTTEGEGLDILPVIDTLLTQIRKHPKTVVLIQGIDEWVYLGVPLPTILVQLRRLRAALREVSPIYTYKRGALLTSVAGPFGVAFVRS